jgi:hypothetical protein
VEAQAVAVVFVPVIITNVVAQAPLVKEMLVEMVMLQPALTILMQAVEVEQVLSVPMVLVVLRALVAQDWQVQYQARPLHMLWVVQRDLALLVLLVQPERRTPEMVVMVVAQMMVWVAMVVQGLL